MKKSRKSQITKFIGKVYKHFTLGVYVRFFLEAFQFLILSSISEIASRDVSNPKRQISLSIAWIFLVFSFLIFLKSISYLWRKEDEIFDERNYDKFEEINSGLKSSKISKIYTPILLTRRYLFILILTLCSNQSPLLIVIGMLIIQSLYVCLLLILRPAEDPINNIIECTNEVLYTVMIAFLWYFNKSYLWTSSISSMYVWLMLSNTLIITIILTGKIVRYWS